MVTVAMRNGFAWAKRWELETSGPFTLRAATSAMGQGRPDSFASTLKVQRSAVGSGSGRHETAPPMSKLGRLRRFGRGAGERRLSALQRGSRPLISHCRQRFRSAAPVVADAARAAAPGPPLGTRRSRPRTPPSAGQHSGGVLGEGEEHGDCVPDLALPHGCSLRFGGRIVRRAGKRTSPVGKTPPYPRYR